MAYANVTAAVDTKKADGKIVSMKMDAVKIFKGSLVTMDASAGYCTWGNTSNGNIASRPFLGVAYETVDNSAGTAGDKSIRIETTGVHTFAATGTAAQTWVGKEVYLSSGSSGNPGTVVLSDPGTGAKVGRVVEFISATSVRVLITGYAFNVDTQAS